MPEDLTEVPLLGGNVAAAVVRVGDTVRKPVTPATPAVEALLRHLEAAGFEGAPRSLGRDGKGRYVLEYVRGSNAFDGRPLSPDDVHRVGALVRRFHDAVQGFRPPDDARWHVAMPADGADLVCHNDLAPWNLVRGDDRWVFVDWDGAGPGTRLGDLGYAGHGFAGVAAGSNPDREAELLCALADGYGLDRDDRARLPRAVERRTRAMETLLREGAAAGREPWARLFADGHADHWGPAADHAAEHQDRWVRALLR